MVVVTTAAAVTDCVVDDDCGARMTICGTHEYMAPELLFDEEYGPAVDVFSFGMVLWEVRGIVLCNRMLTLGASGPAPLFSGKRLANPPK